MKKIILAFTALFFIILTVSALALPPQDGKSLQRAKRYAALGRIDEAVAILNPLLEKYPTDVMLLQASYSIYFGVKDYDKALEFLNRMQRSAHQPSGIYFDFASVYLKKGESDTARIYFDKFIKGLGHTTQNYKRVSQALQSNGYYQMAAENYHQGRNNIKDTAAFALELGRLYHQQRDYYQAAHEFYLYMSADTMNYRAGSSQIKYLIKSCDDLDQIKKAFDEIIIEQPDNHLPYLNYAEIFILQEQFDSAFLYFQKSDQNYADPGRFMIDFSKTCLDKNEYEMVSKVSQYMLGRNVNARYVFQTKLNLAQAYIFTEKPDSAVQIYHKIIDSSNSLNSRIEGNFLLGSIFLRHMHQSDSARHYFYKVMEIDPSGMWRDRAHLWIADSYLIDDHLDQADSIYLLVNTNRLKKEEKEDLLFKRAQIKFFKKEFSGSRGLYDLLVGVHPRSMYVNDCLRKMLIIDENEGMSMLDLGLYAQAERMIWQNKPDSALQKLIDLSGRGQAELSALATFRVGEIYYLQKEYQQAFEYFSKILDGFADSYYSAESQKYVGDLYFYHFNDKEKAREAYRVILDNYPNKLLYEYARRQLRKLENS